MLSAILIFCGLMVFTSCSNNDDEIPEPTIEGLRDGEWTGSGEGRSGNIIVKIVVKDGIIVQAIVVSQSESVFAQDAINTILGNAVGKQDVMSVEVDGVTGATLTSTGRVLSMPSIWRFWQLWVKKRVMPKTTKTVHATSWLWEPEVPGSRRQWLQLRQVT